MNIGEAVKTIQKQYPSVTISRLRFLEHEGLIKPKRSKGGTREFSSKDIERILKILNLQEDKFYSLKAIKNNSELISKSSIKNINMDVLTEILIERKINGPYKNMFNLFSTCEGTACEMHLHKKRQADRQTERRPHLHSYLPRVACSPSHGVGWRLRI